MAGGHREASLAGAGCYEGRTGDEAGTCDWHDDVAHRCTDWQMLNCSRCSMRRGEDDKLHRRTCCAAGDHSSCCVASGGLGHEDAGKLRAPALANTACKADAVRSTYRCKHPTKVTSRSSAFSGGWASARTGLKRA